MIESGSLKTEHQKFDSGNNIEQFQTSLSHTVMRKTCGQSPEVNSKFSGTLIFIYLLSAVPIQRAHPAWMEGTRQDCDGLSAFAADARTLSSLALPICKITELTELQDR